MHPSLTNFKSGLALCFQNPSIFRTLSFIVDLDICIFTSDSDIFSHMTYLESCVTLAYSEPCHIQNVGIFRTQDMFRTLSRHILVYAERCVTLVYLEPCYIQNFAILRFLTYLGPRHIHNPVHLGIFRHIQ